MKFRSAVDTHASPHGALEVGTIVASVTGDRYGSQPDTSTDAFDLAAFDSSNHPRERVLRHPVPQIPSWWR